MNHVDLFLVFSSICSVSFDLFCVFFGSSWGATFHLEKVREVKRHTPRGSEKPAFSLGGPQEFPRRSLEGP